MKRRVSSHIETWMSLTPFRISRHTSYEFPSVVCELGEGELIGRGEALGVYYFDETAQSMLAQLESVAADLSNGASRQDLLELLPPGGARCAADAALWDLEAQQSGVSAWSRAGVSDGPVESCFTIGLEAEPEEMAAKAAAAEKYSLLKIKLSSDRPVERIAAIREARPEARLIVDVNEDWNFKQLKDTAPKLAALYVELIEQPLPRGADSELKGYTSPLPLCADESCQHMGELDECAERYQMINIKLDKTGGLTHGLELAKATREKGLAIFVGCMCGTSLSMAPHHVLSQIADYVDIDGPLLLRNDRLDGLVYDRGRVSLPEKRFWGR